MSERTIFLAALDIADPAVRIAYINQTCGDDAAGRKRIARLLDAHLAAGDFLGHAIFAAAREPAPAQLSGA